jgi:hypothetical protein
MAALVALVLTLLPTSGWAQSDEGGAPDSEEADGLPTWRPSSGSWGTGASQPQQRSGEAGVYGARPVRTVEEEAPDSRPELLAFDLQYGTGVTFAERYQERLQNALWETLEEAETLRLITRLERSRRLRDAAQLAVSPVNEERAETMAEAVAAPYYLVASIEVESSRTYRIVVAFGEAGTGEQGLQLLTATSTRRIDTVESRLVDLVEEAVAMGQL